MAGRRRQRLVRCRGEAAVARFGEDARIQEGMDTDDADEAKASGEEAPGGGRCKIVDASVHVVGSLLEKGEAREIREVERERSTVSK